MTAKTAALQRVLPLQVVILYLGSLSEGMLDGFMAVVLPLYVADRLVDTMGLPVAVVAGVLLSLSGLVDSILLPFAGSYSDRVRRRKLFIQAGRTLVILTIFVFTAWPTLYWAALLRVLQGIGISFLLPSSLALISELMPAGTRAAAMSFQTTLRMVGSLLGPIMGGLAQTAIGFEQSFWIMGGLWILVSLLIAFLVKDKPINPPAGHSGSRHASLEEQNAGMRWLTLRDMLLLGASMFAISYCAAMIASVQTIVNERLNQTAVAFGVAYSATSFIRIGLQIPVGYLVERYKPKPFILLGLVLMGLSTMAISYVANTGQLIFLRVLQGLGMTFSMVPVLGMAASLSGPKYTGRNLGISTSGFGLGMSIGPLATGFLASYFSLQAAFIFSAVLCGIITALIALKVGSYSLRVPEHSG